MPRSHEYSGRKEIRFVIANGGGALHDKESLPVTNHKARRSGLLCVSS